MKQNDTSALKPNTDKKITTKQMINRILTEYILFIV